LTHERAARIIRGHWGGVEIRNHWIRDACLHEDKTRSRNPRIVANLAMLRNTLLKIIADHKPADTGLPAFCEALVAKPGLALKWICR
jgi:predicted transposase YbfD/YdcC